MSDTHTPNKRTVFLALAVLLWVGATAVGLWWFQSQSLRPFVDSNDNPALMQAAQIQQRIDGWLAQHPDPQPAPRLTLIHFWNPDCLCNQVSQRHFSGLLRSQPEQQMRRIVLTPTGTSDEQIRDFRAINGENLEIYRIGDHDFPIPASPALALVDPRGKLSYFGAYGFGAMCSVSSDDFFPNITRQMLSGAYGPFINIAGSGCFCAWPSTARQLPLKTANPST